MKDAPWLTYPGMDAHVVYLPLRGTAHDPSASPASCEGCHTGTSFKEFVCTTCHTPALTDPIHATSFAAGYVPGVVTSADCYRCHPQGTGIAPAAHGLLFPIGTAAHPAACRMCHTDPAARKDLTKLACATCHQGQAGFSTAHAKVKDYPGSTGATAAAWCLRCHANGQVDRISSHGRRTAPGGDRFGGGPGDGDHDTRCFTCHTMVPPDPVFGGTGPGVAGKPWAQDWRQASCKGCH